ncbi:MAG: hypothetical protein PF513_04310 [Tenericutes bacterium]|jgi:hypothetical protein|nr:hypothetical protein [Mycoplasmatota bacterium]
MSKFKENQEFFDFSVNMVVVPIKDIVDRMIEHHVKLPLFVYRFLLKETIRDEVFEPKRFETYTDELQYRLRNYDSHSIFLLEKLIHQYDINFELSKFKEMLFNFLYLNIETTGIDRSFFDQIIELKDQYELEVENISYDTFYHTLEPALYLTTGYIDGLRENKWTDETLSSHTLGDLKALGQKYDIKVPRRINKSRLIEILAAKLKLTDKEIESLSKKSILDIEIYAKEKDFRISTDLKKRDMLEFIKFSLGMYHKNIPTDDFYYDIPINQLDESLEEDIEEEISEPQVEEQPKKIDREVEEEIEIEEIEDIEEVEETEEIEEQPEKIKTVKKPKPIMVEEDDEDYSPTEMSDSELLTEEEKELLDEKIAYIIRKYHKKKKRRKVLKFIFLTLFVLIVAFAAYSYIHFHYITDGELPFNIPLFWK